MDSEQPPMPEPVIKNTPPNRKQRLIILGVAILIIVVVIVVGILVLTKGDAADKPTTSKQPTFQNWLKPASEIKVGDYRYASPCQILPLSTVESTFGSLSPKTVIQENELDQSVPATGREQRLNCVYNPAGDSKAIKTGLETVQYTDISEAKRIGSSFSIFSSDTDKVQAELDLYKKALATNPNKEAQQFYDKLAKSYATYKQYKDSYDEDELAKVDINSLVIPVSDTLSGSGGDFAFTGAHNNVVYTIYHSPKDAKGLNGVKAYSDKELVAELVSMKQATQTIAKNLASTSLDQSPAPTIIGGNTNTFGSTKILEPCAVMTPEVFVQINGGKQQNNPVDRTTVSKDFSTKQYTVKDKSLVLPQNRCARQATDDTTSDDTYGWLKLEYGSSTQQATDWIAKGFKVGSGDQLLQTNADWALAYVDPGRPDEYIYVFRVGPYIAFPTIYSSTGDGEVEASRDQYIQAINTLVPLIQDAAKKAQ